MQTEELKRAAENGDAVAQYNLAVRLGEGTDAEKDAAAAAFWLERAARKGHVSAQYNLALCYETGDGVRKDAKKSALISLKFVIKNIFSKNLRECLT